MKSDKACEQLSLFFAEAPKSIVASPAVAEAPLPHGNSLRGSSEATVLVGDSLRPFPALPAASTQKTDGNGSVAPTECEWSRFLTQHGRVPMIGDDKKPWQYRGWLLYYRLLFEEHPEVCPRWNYWCRTMVAGRMLDEPIPQMAFGGEPDKGVFKDLERWLHLVDRHTGSASAVDRLLDWFLWGFGYLTQESEQPRELQESLYRQVNLGPLLLKPHDYVGERIAMQKSSKWNPHAFFPTPHNVVECMVRMTMFEEEDSRLKTVLDPCVGSGRMLLHASNYSLRLYGVDIDPTMVKVALLNAALYVPWILRPFPKTFFPADHVGPSEVSIGATVPCQGPMLVP